MLREGYRIYLETRKKNDFAFNHYLMRPMAGVVVAFLARTPATPNQITILNLILFLVACAMFIALPTWAGGMWAVLVLEVSYLLDCADGMLARHKKLASKEGHLFDFFTDEAKATALAAAVGVRLYLTGGHGPRLEAPFYGPWEPAWFLIAAVAATLIVASAISLTNFVRRPEISGREQTVEAYYETASQESRGGIKRIAALVFGLLRVLNHYPTHIYLFALANRLDAFFFLYAGLNLLYLARGWLGILVRFARR
ncbi:MAG: CDP-alcohol phosphatidyltransferase family protein [Polyangiaceae bacterium]|nr:CDP-alcohol phosphatidyltransferase family protein [Polyangiaceae bacterium]